ncbi:MAG: hypothetical protein R3C61_26910 [Bacteroidia bacterium]
MKVSPKVYLFFILLFFSEVTVLFANPDLPSGYDVRYYDLEIKLDAKIQRIAGRNRITLHPEKQLDNLVIDLAGNMTPAKVLIGGKPQRFDYQMGKIIVSPQQPLRKGVLTTVEIYFSGGPRATRSENPVWSKAENGKDIISLSPDMLAPEEWWPINADPQDEADSMLISVIFDRDAEVVANGQLRKKSTLPGGFGQWQFFHSGKIHPQNVGIHIGDFVLITDIYNNKSGAHQMQAWVTRAHQARAREYLYELKGMIGFMEKYFGPYPYWKDGYRITEGNSSHKFTNELQAEVSAEAESIPGNDRFLLRQVAFDWFERPMEIKDPRDAWITEALYTYAEFLYYEEYFNAERAKAYMKTERENIPDIPLGHEGSLTPELNRQIGLKGAWLLQTLRTVTDNDNKWFETIRSLSVDFRSKPLSAQDFYEYFSWKLGQDYVYIFREYMTHPHLPVFVYKVHKKGKKFTLSYRWESSVKEFDLPVDMQTLTGIERLLPTHEWQLYQRKGMTEKQIFFDSGAGLYEIRKE